MSDEIKEILEYLSEFINEKEEITKYGCEISVEQAKHLLDYITTLQEENEKIRKMNKAKHKYAMNMEDKYITEKAKNQKAVEYLTSYEAIEKMQQFDHSKNNEGLDYATITEMTRRYLEVNDKSLNILQGNDEQ